MGYSKQLIWNLKRKIYLRVTGVCHHLETSFLIFTWIKCSKLLLNLKSLFKIIWKLWTKHWTEKKWLLLDWLVRCLWSFTHYTVFIKSNLFKNCMKQLLNETLVISSNNNLYIWNLFCRHVDNLWIYSCHIVFVTRFWLFQKCVFISYI